MKVSTGKVAPPGEPQWVGFRPVLVVYAAASDGMVFGAEYRDPALEGRARQRAQEAVERYERAQEASRAA